MEIIISTYNIHRCVGTDGHKDIERVLCVLRDINADIIALQEVETRLGGRDDEDQATYLGKKLNMEVISGPTLRKADEHYGNALLVKHSIDTEAHHDISLPGREPRAAIDVTLDVGEGPFLRVVNTHLGLKRRERHRQIEKLISLLKHKPEKPLVLAGDFNSWLPFYGTIKKLDQVLGDSPNRDDSKIASGFVRRLIPSCFIACLLNILKYSPSSRLADWTPHQPRTYNLIIESALRAFPYLRTYPSFFPLLALDKMWISPPKIAKKKWAYNTRLSRKASDHLPLIATLNL